MQTARKLVVALVTAPDLKTARHLARTVLAGRLAACVNLVPNLESHYWWKDRIESGREVLLLLKTSQARLPALERCVLANHPYDTPELVVLPLTAGTPRYLRWLIASVHRSTARHCLVSAKAKAELTPRGRSGRA